MRRPVTRECLIRQFRSGFRPRTRRQIGLEYELLAVNAKTGRAVTYDDAETSVVRVLDELCREYGWHPRGGEPLLELERKGSRVTLEPGAQVELSLRPHRSLADVEEELSEVLDELATIAPRLGLRFLPLGMQPLTTPEEITIIPKERYRIMTRYLPTRGGLGLWMMRTTAGTQVNLDIGSAEEAAAALRLALCASSAIMALFANSPISAGEKNGWLSRRAAVWLDVDPDRCGIPPTLVEPEASTTDYVDWALDAGMFFVERGEHLCDLSGVPFRSYIDGGRAGLNPVLADWELHLTTLFPEARLKSYLELRCADSNQPELVMAFAALCTGLFYGGGQIREEAMELFAGWSADQRVDFHRSCAREGLAARGPRGGTALDMVRRLLVLSRRGLEAERLSEARYLEPAESLAERGRNPAQDLLERVPGAVPDAIPELLETLAIGSRSPD